MEFVNGMLLEDPDDNGTKEFVCEILVEALLSQLDFGGVDGAALCDRLFALLDFNKQQQQQLDTTTANTLPIAISPTNTIRPRPKTKKTHTPPTDG